MQALIDVLPPLAMLAFIQYCNGEMSLPQRAAFGEFLKLLASTAPLSAIVPLKHIPLVKELLQGFQNNDPINADMFNSCLEKMRFFCPEI